MARKSRRGASRRSRRQHGGGWSFDGPAFAPTAGMAPEAARTAMDDCAPPPPRPAPQVGGACVACGTIMAPQVGGGGGSGGYMPILNNDLGKFHAGYLSGPCPTARQVGGSEAVAAVSYPAGYGYDAASPFTTPSQSSHFLEHKSYGQQCMGGGARRRRHRTRRHRRSQRRR
jgi:hypothetical protein